MDACFTLLSYPSTTDYTIVLYVLAPTYKYKEKLLYAITVFMVPVKVPKTKSLKVGPAAARP